MKSPSFNVFNRIEFLTKRKIINEKGCWLFNGPLNEWGYAPFRYKGKYLEAHRFIAHIVHNLDLNNKKLQALHKCDVPNCFNPSHLFVGTQQQNVRDMWNKRRQGKRRERTQCKKGHQYTKESTLLR